MATSLPPIEEDPHEYHEWLVRQLELADDYAIERMEDERAYGREEREEDLDWTY